MAWLLTVFLDVSDTGVWQSDYQTKVHLVKDIPLPPQANVTIFRASRVLQCCMYHLADIVERYVPEWT